MPEKELPAVVTTAKKNRYENLVTDGSTSEAQVESKPNDEVVENRYIGEIVPFSIESEKNVYSQTNPWAWMGAGSVAGPVLGKTLSSGVKTWMDINKMEAPYSNLWGEQTGYGLYDPEGSNTTRAQSERYQKQFRELGKGERKIPKARLMNLDKALQEIKYREAFENRPKAFQAGEKIGQFMQHYPKISGMLGGMGALGEGAEAYNRWQQGDVPGAIISGLGALGSGASLVPAVSPPTAIVKGIGTTVGALSPLALMAYDKLRK